MKTRIADIITEIPAAGDLVSRCQNYLYDGMESTDVIIPAEILDCNKYEYLSAEQNVYLQSGWYFYGKLLKYNGMMLHASAVEYNGKAYLFSAPSGTGKSTHTQIWQREFGSAVKVFNDDKPALRYVDGKWFAYGTPWCGKDGININMKAPLAGICFLKQAPENRIRRLSNGEAAKNIISQTMRYFRQVDNLDLMIAHVDSIVRNIPVFELENRPEPEAARLSYETMRHAAEELGL